MGLRGLLVHFRAILFNLVLLCTTLKKIKILADYKQQLKYMVNYCLFSSYPSFLLNRTVIFAYICPKPPKSNSGL